MLRVLACSLLVAVCSNGFILVLVLIYMPESGAELGVMGVALIMFNTAASMSLLSGLVMLEQEHFSAMHTLADSERRMRHSQKMAAIGQLSGKVAHSCMNALTAILCNAREAREQVPDGSDAQKLMDRIIASTERISPLTGQLLAFAHPGPLNLRRMDLSTCISGIRELIEKTIGPEIEVVINPDPVAGTVDMDPDQIEQAIVHLAVNAAEAMSDHGRLTISLSRAKLSKREIERLQAATHPRDRYHGPFALISIADTGPGMTEETCSRIFEPFFTTKENRKNAGLGLATVYKIVQLHNGHIEFKTQPGKGATFFIYLPVVDPAA